MRQQCASLYLLRQLVLGYDDCRFVNYLVHRGLRWVRGGQLRARGGEAGLHLRAKRRQWILSFKTLRLLPQVVRGCVVVPCPGAEGKHWGLRFLLLVEGSLRDELLGLSLRLFGRGPVED